MKTQDIHFHACHPNGRVALHFDHGDDDERFNFELSLVMIEARVDFRDEICFALAFLRFCVCAFLL
jgi:hypothetical protein